MSSLKRVVAPTSKPVSLEEAKEHLNETSDDHDDLIEAYIAAATGYAEKLQGRALIDQTWDLYLDAFPTCEIRIPKPPTIEIEGVFYRDSNGDEQEFTDFETDLASEPARLYLASGGSWPTPADQLNAVRVRFRAGYVDDSSPPVAAVPDETIQAIKMVVGTFYANRETVVIGSTAVMLPWAADALLRLNKFDLSMA